MRDIKFLGYVIGRGNTYGAKRQRNEEDADEREKSNVLAQLSRGSTFHDSTSTEKL
jgi:hypothetical protein